MSVGRLLTIALVCAAPLTACTTLAPPGTVASRTTLDEKAGIAVTAGYTVASTLGNRLARAGVIDLARFKALDAKGYAAVLAVKAAYDAGNATDYATAVANAQAAIDGIKSL